MLVTELPQVSFTTAEGKTETTDTIISAKSNVSKDENSWIPLIIPLEYQFAYPDCKSTKALPDDLFANNYFINRSQFGQRKSTTNLKGKEKIEIIYLLVAADIFSIK
jgi:hypothetical protein